MRAPAGRRCEAWLDASSAQPYSLLYPHVGRLGGGKGGPLLHNTPCLDPCALGRPATNRTPLPTGLKLTEKKSGLLSGDPAGYTVSDVLYGGTAGHILGIGIVLGLRGIGAL